MGESSVPDRRGARFLVLAAVFVCAACGLVYELALVALGSYLLGNTITQTSVVIAVSMFAMGLGALVAKPLTARPLLAFVGVELALAVVGGFAVPVLFASFAWLKVYTPAMIVVTLLLGGLVGAEIPLLMELLQRLRRQRASRAVADINAVDYVGALIGGLAFPFLLLPLFGLLNGALLTASLNVLAAWMVALVLTRGSAHAWRLRLRSSLACGTVAAMLVGMVVVGSEFELTARQELYRDPIVHAERSAYQEIVLTRGHPFGPGYDDLRLFLDGDLQFSSLDEYRYHEMLVHPAMAGDHERVLILGGGDGLAAREVLDYPDVEDVTLVDLDPAVVDLAREYEPLVELNEGAMQGDQVDYVSADAFTWVRQHSGETAAYDAIIVDFPDPDSVATAKLYSVEMYGMLARLLAPGGRMVVQAGSPFFAPNAFWSVEETIQEAGYRTVPYHADVPSFGTWGFVFATREEEPRLGLDEDVPEDLRYVDEQVLQAATVFPPDRDDRSVSVSTLLDPAILEYSREGWVGY